MVVVRYLPRRGLEQLRARSFRSVDTPTIADLQWAKSITNHRVMRGVGVFGRGRAPAVRALARHHIPQPHKDNP
jgi:hypothetical protein